jgi:hypothetical protein
MEYHIIETEKYIVRIHNDLPYLEYIIKEGVTMDVEDILNCKKEIEKIRPGVKFYVLSEGIEFFTLTKNAREISATQEYSNNTLAIAFYSTNISILLLGEMYIKINKPVVPTKIFSNLDKAIEWLNERMRKAGLNLNNL